MKPVAVFYHCLFVLGDPPQLLDNACNIITEQMDAMKSSGLLDALTELHVGVNGGPESEALANSFLPEKAKVTYHGLQSHAENLTLVMLEEWVKTHEDWYILYQHSKGGTHPVGSTYGEGSSKPWRQGMTQDLVLNWRQCVADLDAGYDIACSHWMWDLGSDKSQHIPAGNFLWVKSDFARKLPSIFLRDRIKVSGIDNVESRYEAEVYWGNGPRPNVKSYRPNGGGGVP